MRFILASGSPRRRELLGEIVDRFEIIPAVGDEVSTSTDPSQVVQELARNKASEVFDKLVREEDAQDLIVLGSDTIVAAGGQILGKPADREDAARMIRMIQGSVHQVMTGVSLIWQAGGVRKEVTFYENTDVSVYPMTEEEITSYVEAGESDDKAGAYAIQGRFGVFIRGIDGNYNNVMGLPVSRLYQELKGYDLISK